MSSLSAISLALRGVAYAGAITTAARDHGLDPALLAAVAAQETGGPGANAGRNVIGDGGHGRGLFQIDDRYHDFARAAAAMDPGRNAEYAAGMLEGLIHRYGSARRALSAYNSGDPDARGTTTRWSDGSTLGYADSVLRHEQLITGQVPEETASDERGAAAASIGTLASQAASFPAIPLPQPAHIRSFRDVAHDDVPNSTD
jgi:soluble lytic murein transglycosylase-like protein